MAQKNHADANKFGEDKVRGWRRVAYNKIKRNITTELEQTIDTMIEL